MKNILKINFVVTLAIFILLPFISCRKIDTMKLTGDWKITFLNRIYEYKNQRYETKFDGLKKENIYTVRDTLINGEMTTYNRTQTFTGEISTEFKKNGTYYYKETFQNDTTGISTSIDIEGFWYFTGPNSKAGYSLDDMLAMQSLKIVNSTNGGVDHTTIFQGENTLTVFEIKTLTSKKIELEMFKEETINFVKYYTSMKIKYEPY